MRLSLLEKNDFRTYEAQKNIIISFFIRAVGVISSFLLVPLTIDYLDAKEYGIWLTLSSILTWINYFDIGLGNGLRNKLTEALATNDRVKAKTYVSTTFALLSILMIVLYVIFFLINFFLKWDLILNTDEIQRQLLGKLVLVVFAFFSLQFVFKITGTVLLSLQKPALNDLMNVVGSLLSLVIIFMLTKFSKSSLFGVAIIFSGVPVLVFLFSFFFLFFGKYNFVKPSISSIDFRYTKELVGLGLQFFIIQIAVCVSIYSSTNLIIIQLFGSSAVTVYNIAFKYFSALNMVYLIVIMPFWSASTEAYAKGDYNWIRTSIGRLIKFFVISLIITIFMIIYSDTFYKLWLGKNYIHIPLSISILVALYTAFYNWSNTFIYFINGVGKIKLQLIVTVIVAIAYFPLTISIGKIWGINGVLFVTVLSLIPTSILMPIQVKKIYSKKAKGIWNK